MKMYSEPQPLEKYLGTELDCDCGRRHYVPIRAVEIGPGVLNTLPDYVKRFQYRKPYILCDEITWKIAGQRCADLLQAAGIDACSHILQHTAFDEATLGEIVVSVPTDADLMIGVGTGSITDMTRYSSFRLGLPCFTVATGAPMDGFAASIGIMNVGGLKRTMQAHSTELIIGDTDILKNAPFRMTVAGFGDLIGKLTCLNDWKLSRIINGEHYCAPIVELVQTCLDRVMEKAPLIAERDPEVLGSVMEGLVLSGAAISLYGTSRPASGAEHHMSHFWEVVNEQRGTPGAMHGEQVAVGTVLVLMLAEELCRTKMDFDAARADAERFDTQAWEREIRRCFGNAAQEALDIEAQAHKNAVPERLARIGRIQQHWDEILQQLSSLPEAESLQQLLKQVGCPSLPEEIGVDETLLRDTFRYAKETRARYTLLQLVFDLGLVDSLTDRVIERLRRYCPKP